MSRPYAPKKFQSTRPHGARRQGNLLQTWLCRFNPRARTGRDTLSKRSGYNLERFNPRARTGRDSGMAASAPSSAFQSTRPHGARQTYFGSIFKDGSFNPRARTGRDGDAAGCVAHFHVSIHAPARGATKGSVYFSNDLLVSIHAPARGATRRFVGASTFCQFQSTRPHGARRQELG